MTLNYLSGMTLAHGKNGVRILQEHGLKNSSSGNPVRL